MVVATLGILRVLYWCIVLVTVVGVLVRPGWRRAARFRLPPRGGGSREAGRLVETYVPPFGRTYGHLTVSPGSVQVGTYFRARPLAKQTQGSIIAVHARFGLPTMREGFVIRGEHSWCGVALAVGSGRTIRRELEQAGFKLVNRSTRFRRYPVSPSAYLVEDEGAPRLA